MVNQLSAEARDDVQFRVLRLLSERPHASQREISAELGISLGRANYCLKALIARGYVRIENFRASPHKRGYLHVLTPGGIAARALLARRFLQRKLAEYAALEAEIAALRAEAARQRCRAPGAGAANG